MKRTLALIVLAIVLGVLITAILVPSSWSGAALRWILGGRLGAPESVEIIPAQTVPAEVIPW